MQPSRIATHIEDGLDKLLEQYKQKPRIEAWHVAYLRQFQKIEDAILDVIIGRLIDYAEGVQLDVIGRIVGEFRQDRIDALYRLFIRARIRINRSLGRLLDLTEVFAIVSSVPALIDEYSPQAVLLECLAETENDPVLIFDMLRDTKAGGVWFGMVVPTSRVETRFLLGSTDDPDDPSDHGMGDADALNQSFGLLSDAVNHRALANPYIKDDGDEMPGGSDHSIQFRSGTSFGGFGSYDPTKDILVVGGKASTGVGPATDSAGTGVNLKLIDATDLSFPDNSTIAMRLTLSGSRTDAPGAAREVHELLIRTHAGAIVTAGGAPLDMQEPPAGVGLGAFGDASWSVSFVPSGLSLAIHCVGAGGQTVIFQGLAEWFVTGGN